MSGSDGKYQVYWNVNEDLCVLEMGLMVETNGWIGIGISRSGSMKDSDIVMGWIADGEYILQHRYGTESVTPELFDDQSHIKKIKGWKEVNASKTITYLHFEKEIFVHFDKNVVDINKGITKVIWAWKDGELSANEIPTYHGRHRGTQHMQLFNGPQPKTPLPNDVLSFDIIMPNISIPNKETTYYCLFVELPVLENTHHIIQFDPLIQSDIVHHVLIYNCPKSSLNNIFIKNHIDKSMIYTCGVVDTHCIEYIAGFTAGGQTLYIPKNMGIELSGPKEDTFQYAVLQVHYHNPTLRDDIIDTSGLRLWYTPTLRTYSGAVIILGITPTYLYNANGLGLFIPPGIKRAVNYGYCLADCLQNAMDKNENKMYALGNFFHMHVLGREQYLRHIRNGKELALLDMESGYDFSLQHLTIFSQQIEILAGDELIVECVYDSTEKNTTTYGGPATYDEMCLSFLLVYPKPKIKTCVSDYWIPDLIKFNKIAHSKGYYNKDSNIYDVNVSGALKFYNDFQKGNMNYGCKNDDSDSRIQICQSSSHPWTFSKIQNIPRPGIEYEPYNMEIYHACKGQKIITTDIEEQQEHLVNISQILLGVLEIFCVLIVVWFCWIKKSNIMKFAVKTAESTTEFESDHDHEEQHRLNVSQ
eukprot:494266_1